MSIKNLHTKSILIKQGYNIGFFILIVGFNCFNIFSQNKPSFEDEKKNPHYTVASTLEKIDVDGLLNENFWDEALEIELPYEVVPGENLKAPVKTYVLLSYTKTHLYIGFKAFDPEPKDTGPLYGQG